MEEQKAHNKTLNEMQARAKRKITTTKGRAKLNQQTNMN